MNPDVFEERANLFLKKLELEKRLQPTSLNLYRRELKLLKQILLSVPSSRAFRKLQEILGQLSPATASRKTIIWRSFLNTCPDPYPQLLKELALPKIRSKPPRFLTEKDIFALENAALKTKSTTRDRLLLFLGVELGLRVQEMLQIRFSDLQAGWLRVQRKGGHEQLLPLTPSIQTQFRFLKDERRARDEDFVFEGRDGGALSVRAAQKIVSRLAKQAGLSQKLSPHALRHSFATRLAANGASLVALKELLGHRQLRTTERYLHTTPEHLKDALRYLRPKDL